MKTKKKYYTTPEICELDILPCAMVCQSAIVAGGNDDEVDEGDALSSEYRSDWENIWANM
jgi:hypothetical protein